MFSGRLEVYITAVAISVAILAGCQVKIDPEEELIAKLKHKSQVERATAVGLLKQREHTRANLARLARLALAERLSAAIAPARKPVKARSTGSFSPAETRSKYARIHGQRQLGAPGRDRPATAHFLLTAAYLRGVRA